MKSNIGILSSNAVTRSGNCITLEAHAKSLYDHSLEGAPYLLNHDIHDPLGWVLPFGLLLQPKLCMTIGNFLTPDTHDERKLILKKINHVVKKRHSENYEEIMNEFKNVLGDNFDTSAQLYSDCYPAYYSKNIVAKAYPHLVEKMDKDGLVFLDELLTLFDYVGCGIFKNKKDKTAIFAHRYFRRNLSHLNKMNSDFIESFMKSQIDNIEARFRIAIDLDLIGLAHTFITYVEQDYWWGPKFDDDISSLPNDVTRHQNTESARSLTGIQSTEFWWKTDSDNNRVLEMEEVKTAPSLGESQTNYGCRYIHSIYDTKKGSFNHFDGAIRMYDEDSIVNRWDTPINKAGKGTVYTKLFRIDGKIPLSDWKRLCTFYFRGNILVYEYFNKKEEFESLFKSEITKPDDYTAFVPCKISARKGMQLFISHHRFDPNIINSYPRSIINPESFTLNNVRTEYVEVDVLEIKKILMTMGEELYLSPDIAFIKPLDYYTNFPTIIHTGKESQKLAENTLEAYKQLFAKMRQKLNGTYSLSLAVVCDERIINISAFGDLNAISDWLDSTTHFPVTESEFLTWITEQSERLSNLYETWHDFDYLSLLRADGYQFIERKQIDRNVEVSLDDYGLCSSVKVNEEDVCYNDLKSGLIFPSSMLLLKDIRCSKTKENYIESKTSKHMDSDVNMEIVECELLTTIWTDKLYK